MHVHATLSVMRSLACGKSLPALPASKQEHNTSMQAVDGERQGGGDAGGGGGGGGAQVAYLLQGTCGSACNQLQQQTETSVHSTTTYKGDQRIAVLCRTPAYECLSLKRQLNCCLAGMHDSIKVSTCEQGYSKASLASRPHWPLC